MKAAVYDRYGGPDRIHLAERAKPSPGPGQVLVRVHACSVNSWDWDLLIGNVYGRLAGPFGPRYRILGADLAGVVEAVGEDVTRLTPGDAVAGDMAEHGFGGFAEYVVASEGAFVAKPDALSFEEAAAVPQAGLLAHQALRWRRPVAQGDHILVIGAGGGCGSFAVQLAKRMGATVTAVDHGRKLDFMRELGADQVMDYEREDFAASGVRYDRIIDPVAKRPMRVYRQSLKSDGTFVVIGGKVRTLLATVLAGIGNKPEGQHLGLLIWRPDPADMVEMLGLCVSGAIRPMVDRVYPLEETGEALRRVGEGRSLGKVVVRVAR